LKYVSKIIPKSGIPLGGLGTGYFEIRPDGRFYEWQILNNNPWRGCGSEENCMGQDDFFFAARVKVGDEVYVRILRLGVNDLGGDLYHMPWLKNIEEIEYIGEYPIALLKFKDNIPVEIRLRAYTPFIPGDVKNSSLPTAIFEFEIRNTSDIEVEVSILSACKNPIGYGYGGRILVNKAFRGKNLAYIHMYGANIPRNHGTYNGSMTLAVVGPSVSYHAALPKKIERMREMWIDFRSDGCIDGVDEGTSSEDIYGVLARKVKVEAGGEEKIVFILTWFFPNHIDCDGIYLGHMYENWFRSSVSVLDYVISNLKYLRERTLKFHDILYSSTLDYWIIDTVTSQLTTLVTNSFYTKDGSFGIWEGGPGCCGLNTLDVAYYGSIPLVLMFPELEKTCIRMLAKFQLDPSKPQYSRYVLAFQENVERFKEEVSRNPSIAYDEKRRIEVLKRIARITGKDPTGRMPHFFPKTFSRVDAYHMVDLMPKFILMVYRDYLWTGDRKFLEDMWSKVKLSVETVLKTMDELGYGLPYHYMPSGFDAYASINLSHNILSLLMGKVNEPISFQTYDGWCFLGYSSYVCMIWLAALKAVVKTAEMMGEKDYADKIRELYEKARKRFIQMLWNGEYFDLWYDPVSGLRDSMCMADQLNGQWYANLCRLGRLVEEFMIRSSLKAILKYNYKPEEGLINGAYPSGERPSFMGEIVYPNGTNIKWRPCSQSDTPWTGTEYSVASLLIQEGFIEEGLKIARNVYERYGKSGLFWNHIECGGHYYRAMDSWAILTSLFGLNYQPGKLVFKPKLDSEKIKAPLVVNGSWGSVTYDYQAKILAIEVLHGILKIRSLELSTKFGEPSKVMINDSEIPYSTVTEEDSIIVNFKNELTVKEGNIIKIEFI